MPPGFALKNDVLEACNVHVAGLHVCWLVVDAGHGNPREEEEGPGPDAEGKKDQNSQRASQLCKNPVAESVDGGRRHECRALPYQVFGKREEIARAAIQEESWWSSMAHGPDHDGN